METAVVLPARVPVLPYLLLQQPCPLSRCLVLLLRRASPLQLMEVLRVRVSLDIVPSTLLAYYAQYTHTHTSCT